MSRILAQMLDRPQQIVEEAIVKLENATGGPSEDVRMIAATVQASKQKIAALGLDPEDTTPQELYHALLSRFSNDNSHLEKALDIDSIDSFEERAAKAVSLVSHAAAGSACWALKNSTIKTLLSQQLPKKLMKAQSYRSISSMLKHEKAGILLTSAKLTESPTWQKNLRAKIAHLKSTDFEMQPLQVVDLSSKLNLGAQSLAVSDKDAGVVALCSIKNKDSYSSLAIIVALIAEVHIAADSGGKLNLKDLNPALNWWSDNYSLLAWHDGEPVSLNPMDTALNHSQMREFESRTNQHAGKALWQQLIDNYKQHVEELPRELAEIDQEVTAGLVQAVSPVPKLAEELVEI